LPPESLLPSLALIAVLGVTAQWVAWRLNLPSILLLLLTGIAVGPLLGWVDPDALLGELLFPVVSLSVAVILFEGGLTLHLAELRTIGPAVLRLCTVGVACTWFLTALAAHFLVGMVWPLAILLGAILTVTGPTVVGPLLRQVRPRGVVGPVCTWEGIVADVLGATLAVLVFHSILVGSEFSTQGLGPALKGLAITLGTGLLAGLGGATLLGWPLRRHWVPDHLHSPVALVLVLGIYALSDAISPESGLLAVTLMGVALRNQRRTPVGHIIEFKENVRTLLISVLFIVLAARIKSEEILNLGPGAWLFVAALILVVRPAAVALSTLGSSLSKRERIFIAGLAPRGIVAAAVSALFGEELLRAKVPGLEGIEQFAPLAFLVIVVTVVVYGLGARPLARALKLAEAAPQGVLIVGANPLAKAIAHALGSAGLKVVLVDSNHAAVVDANLEGLTARFANVLTADSPDRLPLGGIGHLLALTPNHEVNSLACLHYQEIFGRARCFQIALPGSPASGSPGDLRGRDLFGEEASLPELLGRMERGEKIRVTPLSEAFGLEAWSEEYGPHALPLFSVDATGFLRANSPDRPLEQNPDAQLIGLVGPGRSED
jgi:CPA1 family monovalent cation:H+ antiporter